MDNINPYQAPPETIDGRPPFDTHSIKYASRWLRLGGAMIDSLIVLPLFVVLSIWYLADLNPETQVPWSVEQQFASILLGLVVFLALNGFLIYYRGQTLGKLICRTVVVNKSDLCQVSGNRYVFLRYLPIALAGGIPVIGGLIGLADTLAIFRPEKNCLHDDVAGTRVIMRSDMMRLRN
ncbi:MAG: RDD family protein [Pirellulales bacterium]|nr:RDD family protein [Pirellulales bacterium]